MFPIIAEELYVCKFPLLRSCLTTHPNKYKVDIQSPLGSSDHCLISAEFAVVNSTPILHPKLPPRTLWHYNRANWIGMNEFFQHFDWSSCFLNKNVDIVTLLISTVILTAMNEFVPSSTAKAKSNKNNWFNNSCKIAIAAKHSSYKTFKSDPTPVNKAKFIHSRNIAKDVIRNAKLESNLKLKNNMRRILDNTDNKRTFWTFVTQVQNNFLTSSKSSIPTLKSDGQIFTTALEKANCLVTKFALNSQIPVSNQHIPCIQQVSSSMKRIYFRPRVVSKVLSEICVNKSAGPDGIPSIVLKKCHNTLAKPLSKLFYLSMSSGVFSAIWKTANAHPIPKKGVKSDPR